LEWGHLPRKFLATTIANQIKKNLSTAIENIGKGINKSDDLREDNIKPTITQQIQAVTSIAKDEPTKNAIKPVLNIAGEILELVNTDPFDAASDYLMKRFPTFIYFESYAIIDSRINLPSFVQKVKSGALNPDEKTAQTLFSMVNLDPELEGHAYLWHKQDMNTPQTLADLLRFVRKYDLVHVHAPGANHAWMFDRPYVLWDGGSGNFIMSKTFEPPEGTSGKYNHEAGRRGYKKAKYVFYNDINVIYTCARKMPWLRGHKYGYMPLPVDTDVFRPLPREGWAAGAYWRIPENKRFTVYHPTRQEWGWKGVDDILKGFKRFTQDVPTALLLITRYGSDVPMTAFMIRHLKLEENVKFVPLLPKQDFARLINAVDVVIDQVKIHSVGGVTVQAMACEKPVIVSANQRWYNEQLGEGIPVVNAKDEDGVYQALLDVYYGKHGELGKDGRRFVERHHDYRVVSRE